MSSIFGMVLSLPFILGVLVALFVWPIIRRRVSG